MLLGFLTTINRSQLSVRGFGLRLHLYAVLISICCYLACIRFCGLTYVIMDVLEFNIIFSAGEHSET
jgi:hypothetical protein